MSMIRCFSALIFLCQHVTHNKKKLRRKPCSIIVTDVNMMSKRTFLQKVTAAVTNFNDQKRGFYLNKAIVLGVFSVTTITMDTSLRKTQIENIGPLRIELKFLL